MFQLIPYHKGGRYGEVKSLIGLEQDNMAMAHGAELISKSEFRFLQHPGILVGRKIWQKYRKIRKKAILLSHIYRLGEETFNEKVKIIYFSHLWKGPRNQIDFEIEQQRKLADYKHPGSRYLFGSGTVREQGRRPAQGQTLRVIIKAF